MAFSEKMKIISSASAKLPTEFGNFNVIAFSTEDKLNHAALVSGQAIGKSNVLVRIHSECLTGDVFHSMKCDCRKQLEAAVKKISKEGGIIVYLRQEGRGIGLYNKIRAYGLQEKGMDTVEANTKLGFDADERDYLIAADILRHLKVKSVRLMTNNPEKVSCLEKSGIKVEKRIPILTRSNRFNKKYLESKKKKLGHFMGA